MIKLSVKRDELEINLEADELNEQETITVMAGVAGIITVSESVKNDVPFDFDAVIKKFAPNAGDSDE